MATPTKEKRISYTTAGALAQQVSDKFRDVKAEVAKRHLDEWNKSAENKKLKSIRDKMKKQLDEFKALVKAAEKKYPNVSLRSYSDFSFSVSQNCPNGIDLNRVRQSIIVANHVDGVAISDLVNHVVKQELARVEPKCGN